MAQKARPAGLVLLGPFADAEDLAISLIVDAYGHQYRHVGHFAAPGALEHDAVQIDIGKLPFDGTVTPLLDLGVDLLVEVADGAGTDLGSPQGFGNVFDAPDRNTGQVHLNQRLFHRGFTPAVALDDGRFKGLSPQLRHVQGHFSGLGLELSLVMASPGIGSSIVALILLGGA